MRRKDVEIAAYYLRQRVKRWRERGIEPEILAEAEKKLEEYAELYRTLPEEDPGSSALLEDALAEVA
mgnify:CR=1 FL=1